MHEASSDAADRKTDGPESGSEKGVKVIDLQAYEFGRRDLVLSASLAVFLAVCINFAIAVFELGDTEVAGRNPGAINSIIYTIVPFVWLVLFAAMGAAIALLRGKSTLGRKAALPAIGLLVNCTLYPVYTIGFSSMDMGLAGNFLTAVLSALAVGIAWPISRLAALLLAPVAIWVCIASIGLVAVMTERSF
jgi:hypothetical protein